MIASDDRSDIAVTPSGADARLTERPRSRAIVPAGRSAAVLPVPDRAVRPWQPASGTRRRSSTWRGGSQSAHGPRPSSTAGSPPSWRAAPRALPPLTGSARRPLAPPRTPPFGAAPPRDLSPLGRFPPATPPALLTRRRSASRQRLSP